MRAIATMRRDERGFSLVELLVTIVLAGIIFLAMVPLFVSGLKTTSTNARRVVATNIAQARLETIRMLAASMAPSPSPYSTTATTGYSAVTNANLTSATWNAALLPTTYTPPAGGQPYNITYSCSPTRQPDPRIQDSHGDGLPAHRQLQDDGEHGDQNPMPVTVVVDLRARRSRQRPLTR